MKNPCYGCKARHTRCHVDCDGYKEFKAERDRINAAKAERIREDNDVKASKKAYKRS